MKFNKVELTAIMNLAHAMIVADRRVEDEEISMLSKQMIIFGVPLEEYKEITLNGRDMDPDIAIEIVSKMNPEQKKYVAAYLGTIMAIDKDIDDKEIALWKLLSKLCGLPAMSIRDAVEYMSE